MPDKYYGVKVSSGKSVRATADYDLLYDTQFESPKVTKPFIGSFNVDGTGNGSTTVPHGLTYAPAVFAFALYPDGKWRPAGAGLQASTDRNNVTLKSMNQTAYANSIFKYKFWILTDPAMDINV